MTEKEYKFLLSENKFFEIKRTLYKIFNNITPILQINYYYDDEYNSLYNQDITLRIRQTGGFLKLQKKSHIIKSKNSIVSDESEEIISSLPKIINYKYYLKGSLVTQRYRIVTTDLSIYFDFDINYYLGVCDYEVEIEIKNGFEQQAESYIALLGLHNSSSTEGKSSRFFKIYNQN